MVNDQAVVVERIPLSLPVDICSVIEQESSGLGLLEGLARYYSNMCNFCYYGSRQAIIFDVNGTQLTAFKPSFITASIGNRIEQLRSSFDRAKNNSDLSLTDVSAAFKSIILFIADLPFLKAAIEITYSNSIKFSMSFPDNIILIISKPLEDLEESNTNDIIYSIFKDKELIASNVSNTKKLVEGFKKFLLL